MAQSLRMLKKRAAIGCGAWLRRDAMPQGPGTRSAERLPLSTAILSNIALSLLMWNIALRLAGLLLAA
jgi:hypothetical protein